MLFLDVAREMMLSQDWSHRAVSVVLESHTGPGRFSFYGANHPDVIEDVHARRVDVSILNPAALLTMAHRGTGAFSRPRDVATIAVLPHDDRLGFAVAGRLGFTHLADIAAARYPLRVSVRGSLDACTSIMVDVVLRAYGFSLDDIRAWGGEISLDQPMPSHPSRIGRLERSEIDAIFDEGVVMWADQVAAAGAKFLPLDPGHLEVLAAQGLAGTALLFLLAVPAQAPVDERLKRRHQLAAPGGQPVGHLDRHGGHHLAGQYARGFEFLEPLGEHPVRQSRYGRADLGEPARTTGDGHEDGRTPPPTDQLH